MDLSWRCGRKALRWAGLLSMAAALAAPACIISGNKCDAHQVPSNSSEAHICVCEPGAITNANGIGCSPCGTNEEAKDNLCVCKEGLARAGADAGCVPSELGAACSGEAECPSMYPFCAAASSGSGYCTVRDCMRNADCPDTYTCEEQSGTRYCKQAPSGLGAACSSNDDCADFEASTCDLVQTRTCILRGCVEGTIRCPNEWGCCDFSALAGVPVSVCIRPSGLIDGTCPQGGVLVQQ
jgi:hypothetical protein